MNPTKRYNILMNVILAVFVLLIAVKVLSSRSRNPVQFNSEIVILMAVILVFILRVMSGNRASRYIELADKKIKEFKNKNFNSLEEKEQAKQQLKIDLISIKNHIHFTRIRRQMDDKIMSL